MCNYFNVTFNSLLRMLTESANIDDKVELDDFGRPIVKATDSHQVAKMQNERNEKLKAAFGIMVCINCRYIGKIF